MEMAGINTTSSVVCTRIITVYRFDIVRLIVGENGLWSSCVGCGMGSPISRSVERCRQ